MFQKLKNLLGFAPEVVYADLMKEGAVIIDVRSKDEFHGGHIKGSVNMPLPQLQNMVSKLSKEKVIITCCASGMRSASAKSILKSNGYARVYNGGGWMRLKNKIE